MSGVRGKILKKEGSWVLSGSDNRIYFGYFRTRYFPLLLFLTGLSGLILMINALIQLIIGGLNIALWMLILSLLLLFIFIYLLVLKKRREIDPPVYIAELDFDKKSAKFYRDNVSYPISRINIYYRFSFASSCKTLIASAENNKYILAKGDPFLMIYRPFADQINALREKISSC